MILEESDDLSLHCFTKRDEAVSLISDDELDASSVRMVTQSSDDADFGAADTKQRIWFLEELCNRL